jgi:excisionase family DNA binding protein
MATLSLGQAAKLANVGKTTLTRAIKSGRLSAERQVDGSYRIDLAELSRVYELKAETPATASATSHAVHHATPTDTGALQAQIDGLREILRRADLVADELKADRDHWRKQAESAQRLLSDQTPRRGWFGWRRAG